MRVQDIGSAIAKRYWIIIALVLVATLAAAIVAQVQSPVYKVEILIAAVPPISPTTDLPDATVAGEYIIGGTTAIANAAEGISVAEKVSERLEGQGIDIPPEELIKKASAVPEAQSSSIKITFTDGSPTRVADIANTWGEVLALMSNETSPIFDSDIQQILLGGTISFTNRAVVPEKPTMPKTFAYIGLGFFVGLLLGFLLVIFIEYFDPHFRSAREVEDTLDIPVLGTLPKHKGSRATAILPSFGEGSRTWRAYAELRSGLILSSGGAPGSVLTASATPFQPGPAIATSIAASIAKTGRRTLLIDCDLSERSLSILLEAEGRPGLSDALEKEEDYRGMMVEGKVDNLSFLPAGKKSENSSDLLSLPFFEEELREQEGLFDEVVLYAPPLIGSMDAAIVASQAEASLIIIDADRCTRKAAVEAMLNFERLGIVPLGAVLANVKMKGRDEGAAERESKAPPEARKKGEGKKEKAPAGQTAVAATVKEKKKKRAERKPLPSTVETGEAVKTAAGPPQTGMPATTARPAEKPATIKPPAGQAKKAPDAAETVKPEPAPKPAEAETGPPKWHEPSIDAERPVAGKPGFDSTTASPRPGGAAEDIQQVKESVAEDFRRMGEKGDPIPKNWLRALNSDKDDVRESATNAIAVYYRSFLRRYSISAESIERITGSIIMMMRREGEFAGMSEEEAQRHLRQMLVDAGARFSDSQTAGGAAEARGSGAEAETVADNKGEKSLKRQEKRRFRLDAKGGRKASGKDRGRDSQAQGGDEEGVDWE